MGDTGTLNLETLNFEIEKVKLNIENTNKLKNDTIDQLEMQKKYLRVQINAGDVVGTPMCEKISAQIKNIEAEHKDLSERIEAKFGDITKAKISIELLTEVINELDKEIARIQDERYEKVISLEQKIEELQNDLTSIEKMGLLIEALTYKVYESQEEYATDIKNLNDEREAILNDSNLTEEERALALAELDLKLAERKKQHEEAMFSLQQQRTSLQNESQIKMEKVATELEKLQKEREDLINELKARQLMGTPSEQEAIAKQIAELEQKQARSKRISELEQLLLDLENKKLNATPSQLILIEEQINAILNELNTLKREEEGETLADLLFSKGLTLTPSGHILTSCGKIYTLQEAREMGLLDGIRSSMIINFMKGKLHKGEGDSIRSSSSSSKLSEDQKMTNEDVHYLKTVVGKPLTLALAEVTMKQPRDPIHYLSHWLIKYRYNQELDEIQKKEVDELTAERTRIAKETLHRIIEEEARAAVLEMIARAEDIIMRKRIEEELRRIAMESAMMEEENLDELEEEARDKLGTYGGPPVSQNRI